MFFPNHLFQLFPNGISVTGQVKLLLANTLFCVLTHLCFSVEALKKGKLLDAN